MGVRAVSQKRRTDFSFSDSEERIVLTGFFNERDLEIFFELIRHRRQLPVFHGDFWRCYDCSFESRGFKEMAVHIMRYHEPMSISVEDELEQELAAV
jgi:hypothetical protein